MAFQGFEKDRGTLKYARRPPSPEQRAGRVIVNISSVNGLKPSGLANYSYGGAPRADALAGGSGPAARGVDRRARRPRRSAGPVRGDLARRALQWNHSYLNAGLNQR